MLNKKVSIIVATRNRTLQLSEFLDSLVKTQILSDPMIEVIIVDNAPDDNSTLELCRKFPVVYVIEKQIGESFALNAGVRASKGEYVINTDDDIIVNDKDWVNKLLENFENQPNLGYVAGNVRAYNTDNSMASLWDKKGGLSKGEDSRYYKNNDLKKNHRYFPWPINKIAAGANNIVPRKVYDGVGPYATFLGGGSPIGHGNSLEFVYRIIKAGYDVKYDSKAEIYHYHPTTENSLKRKLYIYGIGNSAYQLYIFAKYKDLRSLYWGLLGHHLYVVRNLFRSLVGKYAFTPTYVLRSLQGSLMGTISFLPKYLLRNRHLYL